METSEYHNVTADPKITYVHTLVYFTPRTILTLILLELKLVILATSIEPG